MTALTVPRQSVTGASQTEALIMQPSPSHEARRRCISSENASHMQKAKRAGISPCRAACQVQSGEGRDDAHLLAMPADVLQPDSIPLRVRNAVPLPDHLVEAAPAAMLRVGRVVHCQFVCGVFQRELRVCYAVGHAAHHSAKVGVVLILQQTMHAHMDPLLLQPAARAAK